MSALAHNYKRKNLSFIRGKGSFLITRDGKKYLDFVQGIAVNSLGHSNKKLIRAINHQSKKLWHVSNAFRIPEGEKLASKLVKKTFADSIIFQKQRNHQIFLFHTGLHQVSIICLFYYIILLILSDTNQE